MADERQAGEEIEGEMILENLMRNPSRAAVLEQRLAAIERRLGLLEKPHDSASIGSLDRGSVLELTFIEKDGKTCAYSMTLGEWSELFVRHSADWRSPTLSECPDPIRQKTEMEHDLSSVRRDPYSESQGGATADRRWVILYNLRASAIRNQ